MKINLLSSLMLKFRNCRYVCSANGKMWGIGEVMGASNSIYFKDMTCKKNTPDMQIYPKTFTQDCGSNILPKVNLKFYLECRWNFFNDGKRVATIRLRHNKTSHNKKWYEKLYSVNLFIRTWVILEFTNIILKKDGHEFINLGVLYWCLKDSYSSVDRILVHCMPANLFQVTQNLYQGSQDVGKLLSDICRRLKTYDVSKTVYSYCK